MTFVLSVDMEGVCGVSSWLHVSPPEYGGHYSAALYEATRLRMTAEANAAALGCFDAGASSVLVVDSHDGMRNLIPENLDPRATLINGPDRPLSMAEGVDRPGVAGLLFVGYHARAGSTNAPLAHTWDGHIANVRINDLDTGEYGMNARLAAHFGVPTIFASGDAVAMDQITAELGTDVRTVAVKRGLGYFSADHLHPDEACARIRAKAAEAVHAASTIRPIATDWPARCELAFDHVARADAAARVPGVSRVNGTTVGWQSPLALHLFAMFRTLAKVGSVELSLM
jgi:D-amino peptidase